MNSKIKIGLIVLFIVVFFILLRIRKIESYSKNFPYHSLTKSIELFYPGNNLDINIFRKAMYGSLNDKNIEKTGSFSIINNVTISHNTSDNGGGLAFHQSTQTITNVIIRDNL